MKVILFLAAVVVAAVARPSEPLAAGVIPIVNWQLERDDLGQYALSYLTGDGTRVVEQGALVPNADNSGYVLVKKGSYEYYASDGSPIKTTWVADKEGFRAEGDHLPTTPATPSA